MNYPKRFSNKYWVYLIQEVGWFEMPRAWKAVLPGFEEFDLFYHRSFGMNADGRPFIFQNGAWCISEALTGYVVISERFFCATRKEALQTWEYESRHHNRTPAKFWAAIEKTLKNLPSVSPRYKQG